MIEELFEAILQRVSAYEPRAREVMVPGATDAEIDAVATAIGMPIAGQLRELYRIVNGVEQTEPPVSISFPAYFYFYQMSLKQVVEMIEYLKQCDYFDGEVQPHWFPLLADNMSSYFYVDTLHGNCLRYCDVDDSLEEAGKIEYASIQSFLETIVVCFDEGAYYHDNEGELKENLALMKSIRVTNSGAA